jgi:ABC-type sugar transport system ATPase subunit
VGRAVIRNPKVFLFDEPLSNLDAILREKVRHELKQLFARLHATVIYVTHDQVEATTLADRTIVLDRGTVQQIGTPEALYRRPSNLFVATFVGSPAMNIFDATLKEGVFRMGAQAVSTGLPISGPVKIGIRPEAIKIKAGMPASIALIENLGARYLIDVRVDANSLLVLSEERPHSDSIELHMDPGDIHVFDKNTGENLRYAFDGDIGSSQPENSQIPS